MSENEVKTIYKMPLSKLHELVNADPGMLAVIISLAWNKGVQFEGARLHRYYRAMFTSQSETTIGN